VKTALQWRRGDNGSILPLCLVLTGLLGLFAVNALRSATTEAQLSLSVLHSYEAFALAEQGILAALRYAEQHAANLPEPNDMLTIATTVSTGAEARAEPRAERRSEPRSGKSLAVTITATHSDAQCPAFVTSERMHFEIRSVGRAGAGARRTHVQGFYICRELCDVEGCLAAESAPVPSYWTLSE
jgi:hypothetical protein